MLFATTPLTWPWSLSTSVRTFDEKTTRSDGDTSVTAFVVSPENTLPVIEMSLVPSNTNPAES